MQGEQGIKDRVGIANIVWGGGGGVCGGQSEDKFSESTILMTSYSIFSILIFKNPKTELTFGQKYSKIWSNKA